METDYSKDTHFSMEDKMAGAFGCARNYGWDGIKWRLAREFGRALLIRQHTKVRRGPYQGSYMITSWPGTTMKCWHQSFFFFEFQQDGYGWQSGVIETKRNYVHTKKTWHGILDSPSVIIVFIFTDEAVPVDSLSKDGETIQRISPDYIVTVAALDQHKRNKGPPFTSTMRLLWISWQILWIIAVITNSHTWPTPTPTLPVARAACDQTDSQVDSSQRTSDKTELMYGLVNGCQTD